MKTTKSEQLILSCSANNEYPGESINGFILNLNKDNIQYLLNAKKTFDQATKNNGNVRSLNLGWDEDDGKFTSSLSSKAIILLETKDILDMKENYIQKQDDDFSLTSYEVQISKSGFFITAFEKYSGVEWITTSVDWSLIETN